MTYYFVGAMEERRLFRFPKLSYFALFYPKLKARESDEDREKENKENYNKDSYTEFRADSLGLLAKGLFLDSRIEETVFEPTIRLSGDRSPPCVMSVDGKRIPIKREDYQRLYRKHGTVMLKMEDREDLECKVFDESAISPNIYVRNFHQITGMTLSYNGDFMVEEKFAGAMITPRRDLTLGEQWTLGNKIKKISKKEWDRNYNVHSVRTEKISEHHPIYKVVKN